jgi:hypothetical protein
MGGGDLWSKSRGFERLDAESRNFDCERHNYTSKIKKEIVYANASKNKTHSIKHAKLSIFSTFDEEEEGSQDKKLPSGTPPPPPPPPPFSFFFFLLLFSLHIFK